MKYLNLREWAEAQYTASGENSDFALQVIQRIDCDVSEDYAELCEEVECLAAKLDFPKDDLCKVVYHACDQLGLIGDIRKELNDHGIETEGKDLHLVIRDELNVLADIRETLEARGIQDADLFAGLLELIERLTPKQEYDL